MNPIFRFWRGRAGSDIVGILRHRYLAFVCRMALGPILVVAGVGKLLHQAGLHQGGLMIDLAARLGVAGVVPQPIIEAGAWALPPLEVVLGVLLVTGLFLRLASAATALFILGFIAVNVLSILSGSAIDECGCFGDIATLSPTDALLIDVSMLLMATQVLFHRGEFLSLDARRQTRGRGPGAGGQGPSPDP